ncbi:MAG TPA: hypothetical protein VFW33_04135 [Gemmataceae bacterium]|nr:hypothetical protein [Gemmataceae bacterium]
MHYHGHSLSVTLEGSTAVTVRCEKCGQKYYYRLDCTAVGQCSAPYGFGVNGVRERAWKLAKRRLRDRVETELSAVPCPHCGWYQDEMVDLLRKRRSPGVEKYWPVGVAFGLAGVIGPLAIVFHEDALPVQTMPPVLGYALSACAALLLLAGLGSVLYRRHKGATFDPNDPEIERERIALGRSLAITAEHARALRENSGEVRFVPAPGTRDVVMVYGFLLATYNVSAQGTRVAQVTCEYCGSTYCYRLARTARAHVHAIYDLGGKTAFRRSQDRARAKLRRLLDTATDPVPCPECGWYQKDMLPALRRSRLAWMRTVAKWSPAVALVPFTISVFGLMGAKDLNAPPEWTTYTCLAAATLPLALPVVCFLRRVLNRLYDPNQAITQDERIRLGRERAVSPELAAGLMAPPQ